MGNLAAINGADVRDSDSVQSNSNVQLLHF